MELHISKKQQSLGFHLVDGHSSFSWFVDVGESRHMLLLLHLFLRLDLQFLLIQRPPLCPREFRSQVKRNKLLVRILLCNCSLLFVRHNCQNSGDGLAHSFDFRQLALHASSNLQHFFG